MTEKTLKEHGDKVDASIRSSIEAGITKTKTAMEGSDAAALKSAMEELQQASHKLAEAMYQQTSGPAGDASHQHTGGAHSGASGSSSKPDEDVVDADFEEVKDTKK